MGKFTVLLFAIIFVTSSMMMVKSAYSISAPSIPEFAVTLIAHPYDLSTTYSTNPYTGRQ